MLHTCTYMNIRAYICPSVKIRVDPEPEWKKIPLSTGWEIRLSPWHRGDPTIEQGVNRKNQELTIYNKAERVRKDRVNLCLDDMVAACFGSDVNFTNNDMR